MSSLYDLLLRLDEGRGVPFEWAVAHAPRGHIEDLWSACTNAETLVGVYAHTDDLQGLVAAVYACVNASFARACGVDPRVAFDPLVLDALDTVARWLARGETPPAQELLALVRAATDAAIQLHDVRYGISVAIISMAKLVIPQNTTTQRVACARTALATLHRYQRSVPDVLPILVRAAVLPPTLSALRGTR